MTATPTETLPAPQLDAVVRWRFDALLSAGYDVGSALLVAAHTDADLHEAIRLVECGCAPALAAQIVL